MIRAGLVQLNVSDDVVENLDFIPTGPLPPNRSEFLLRLNFFISIAQSLQHSVVFASEQGNFIFVGRLYF